MNQIKSLKIAKFGGTSNKDAEAVLTSGKVLHFDRDIRLVVISAIAGMTNALMEMGRLASQGNDDFLREAKQLLNTHGKRHLEMANSLNASQDTLDYLHQCLNSIDGLLNGINLLRELTPRTIDLLVSFGELMASKLFAEGLKELGIKAQWFDVRQIMITDNNFGKAEPDLPLLAQNAKIQLAPLLQSNVVVTQGYIGKTPEGFATTLGKEGSDYTTALLGEALGLNLIQIWKDVSGVYTTDPKLMGEAKPIAEISYEETAEFTFFGAKVLHPKTMKPAIRSEIPVFIGNSQNPSSGGTWIKKKTDHLPAVRGIAIRKKQRLLSISPRNIVPKNQFYAGLFKDLWHHNIDAEIAEITENNINIILGENARLEISTINELKQNYNVVIEENFSLLTIIGNHFYQSEGVVAKILDEIKLFKIRSIIFGSGKHAVSFLMNENDAFEALKTIHRKFII